VDAHSLFTFATGIIARPPASEKWRREEGAVGREAAVAGRPGPPETGRQIEKRRLGRPGTLSAYSDWGFSLIARSGE